MGRGSLKQVRFEYLGFMNEIRGYADCTQILTRIMRLTDGYKFDGEFRDDAMSGTGTFTFASGACYNGDFKQNKFEGKGVYQWPSGESYDGEFLESCMHGKGTYKDGCGRQWSGMVKKFYKMATHSQAQILIFHTPKIYIIQGCAIV